MNYVILKKYEQLEFEPLKKLRVEARFAEPQGEYFPNVDIPTSLLKSTISKQHSKIFKINYHLHKSLP